MKKNLFPVVLLFIAISAACQQVKPKTQTATPVSVTPAALQGTWMYGNFSMKEYWQQNPANYLGNALQFAIAFKFYANGEYEQYFTSSSVSAGIVTYQQSVTKGTVVTDAINKTIKTKATSSHYKRTRSGQVVEERELSKNEMTGSTVYSFVTGTEPNGTKAIYLKLQGTANPLTFLQKL
jgi:hypothetical protein